MNPIAIATKGKGPLKMLKRVSVITGRYGVTSSKMDGIMAHFARILGQFNCGATFPITTAALARNRGAIEKYQAQDIEFAVHGYYHIDHTQLSLAEHLDHFAKARQLFEERGVICNGFRCPYLRWSEDTITAVSQSGFLYDSSQGLAWDVVDEVETAAYRRVLGFYGAVPAVTYPALPRWDKGLVRIPYCLPDDESLIDRFQLKTTPPMNKLWLAILAKTYELGELFTLGLHPERIYLCKTPLVETLRRARELSPGVWIGRLDEIARWWKARTETTVTITGEGHELHLQVDGPAGVTILARSVEVKASTTTWADSYRQVQAANFSLNAPRRPFIGVSPVSSAYLTSFLSQQGYIVEPAENDQSHTFYLDRPQFEYEDERPLLAQIEQSDFPLVRLGRWPDGARSALCVTGDIDALTLWDYGLRLVGH